MEQHKSPSLRDMRLVCELAVILKTLRKLKDAELELSRKGFHVDSLSKEIKRVEQRMEVSPGFLVRATPNKGSVITAKGLSTAQVFKEMLATYDRRVRSAFPSRRALVTVGMTNSATFHLLSSVIGDREFLRTWPNTDLEVLEGYADDLQHYLLQLEVDFCVAPKMAARPGVVRDTLRTWRRVLVFRKDEPQFKDLAACRDISDEWTRENTLLECLRKVNVLIPLSRVMPELDVWLMTPTSGRIVKLPQASIRLEWARRGLGVAVVYREPQLTRFTDTSLEILELPESMGTTTLCFYCRDKAHKTNRMSTEAEALMKAIRARFGDPAAMPTRGKGKPPSRSQRPNATSK